MASLFKAPKAPTPAPIAPVPSAAEQEESARKAAAEREAAAAAEADKKMQADLRERAASRTRVAGQLIADEEQQGRGLISAKRRSAARMLGY